MRLTNNKKTFRLNLNVKYIIISLLFLIPYNEIGPIRELLGYKSNEIYIPAIVFIMLAIIIFILFSFILSKKSFDNKIFIKILLIKIVFDFIVIVRSIFDLNPNLVLAQYLFQAVPFYYALSVIIFINKFDFNLHKICKYALTFFIIYLSAAVFININTYGYSLDFLNLGRIISPGGGPVVLGYTIALMSAFLLLLRREFSKYLLWLFMFVLIISSLFTGSRGSMWPLLFVILVYLFDNKDFRILLITLIGLFIAFLIFDPINWLSDVIPRFFNLIDQSRLDTNIQCIKILMSENIGVFIFGKGIGGFFPYQAYLVEHTPGMNLFYYKDYILLVQPHNSFIYILMEAGFFCLLLFVYPLLKALFITVNGEKSKEKKYAIIATLFAIILNLFDSIFVVIPGSAALWWLIVFSVMQLILEEKKNNKLEKEI